jgi:outer membrane autotransporter protein
MNYLKLISIYPFIGLIGANLVSVNFAQAACTDSSGTVTCDGGTPSSLVNPSGATLVQFLNNTGNTLTAVTNQGTIGTLSSNLYAFNNLGSIGTVTNSGLVVSSSNTWRGIQNEGAITNLINSGSITMGQYYAHGVFNMPGATISNMTNSGTITGTYSWDQGIHNYGGTITTVTNTGTISVANSDNSAFGVKNESGGSSLFSIGTLNNSQGAGNAAGALTYTGKLPTYYNIIINSTSNYGRLWATDVTNNTTFGISTLSAGSSAVSGTAYTSVLKGITNTQLGTSGTSIAGTSNNYTYTLSRSDAVNNIWDLIISGFSGSSGGSSGVGGGSPTFRSNTSFLKNHAAGAAGMLDSLSTSTGAMAGVITALNNLSGAAQANAIAQTLPAMAGGASLATTSSMQALNQIVQGRSNSLRGMASGDEYIGNRDVWMKGFGSWANQADVNGVSGYKVNTGGLAIGVDQGFTPKLNIGAVLALSNSGVSSNSNSAPSGVTINSYQAGVYGDYAIDPKIIANAQADIGMNQNKEYRNITFMGTNANGTYNSYSAHLGTGVKYLMPINPENTFIPSVRVDYTTVQSQAYSESGAGALNLSVAKQTYNTLIPSADVRIDHSLDSKMTLSANAGAGYNTLNNQVSATSAYAGGGTTFATNGLQVSPWLYNAGVGVTGQIDKNLQLNVRYDNVFSPTGYMNQMVSAKLKIPL